MPPKNLIVKYFQTNILQDPDQSIVVDGLYDLSRFSPHEDQVILEVLENVQKKYPKKFRAIGLFNEAYCIKYKPRYVLLEIIIHLYADSDSKYDNFAVAMAYKEKGAYFRSMAISYFEKSQPEIGPCEMSLFSNCLPASVYTAVSNLYEAERIFDQAIVFNDFAETWGIPGNNYFSRRKEDLIKKSQSALQKPRVPKQNQEFDAMVRAAALLYVKKSKFKK